MADPWQPVSFNLNLPGWAKVPENLVKGLERADQQKRATGILTGQEPQSWIQRAVRSDPNNWMTTPAPVYQDWRGIYGLTKPAPDQSSKAVDAARDVQVPAPGLGAPDPYGDPAARAREAEQRRMMQQYASKEYWDTEQGKAMLSLGQQMSAPKDAKLADYYGAQRAVGIGSMGEILEALASVDDRYKEGGDLRKWAEANQGLALREYNKRFPGGTTGMGEGELSAPTIDTANPTAGERALMEAKVALHGDPSAAPTPGAIPTPGGYMSDDRVIGLNDQGQFTVGEGAYGFDPAFDQAPMAIAARPVPAEVNRAEAGSAVPVAAQKANELVERYKRGLTRGQLIGY